MRLLLCLMIGLLCVGCETTDLSPAFVYIPDISVQVGDGQGSGNDNISYAFIYLNDQDLGAFPLPASIPILEEGSANLKVFAGVAQNGLNDIQKIYPFFSYYNQTVALSPLDTLPIAPILVYNNVIFALINDFENSNNFETTSGSAPMNITENPAEVFEGNRVGKAHLNTTNDSLFIRNISLFSLPASPKETWVEMDYKFDVPVEVWLEGTNALGGTTQTKIVTLLPKTNWRKTYVSLTEKLSVMKTLDNYHNFKLVYIATLGTELTEAFCYFDNIKILHN